MISIAAGHAVEYLTGQVASGRENYYTGAVATGEPPGVWWGRGAELLGLDGLVDAQDMTALYELRLDPRDDRSGSPPSGAPRRPSAARCAGTSPPTRRTSACWRSSRTRPVNAASSSG